MAPSQAFTFLPLGAILQTFTINGTNIVQNFPTLELYEQHNHFYFGETIGRVANRVSGAKISDLNGTSYPLTANNGPNSLHGGERGWGKRRFRGPHAVRRHGREATLFQYLSADGEEGYPGAVEVSVWYMQGREEDHGVEKETLYIEYEAELVSEEVNETAINMTNHSYFNLAGTPTIDGTQVTLMTNKYQVVDDGGIPTGAIKDYPGISAQQPFTLGTEEPDIDDCFIVDADTSESSSSSISIDTRSAPLRKIASFFHPHTNIHLEISSTEPAFQFYTGKYIDVPAIGDLAARGARSGFCVEPSRYVNAVNMPEHKAMAVLKKGEKYGSRIVYRGWQS